VERRAGIEKRLSILDALTPDPQIPEVLPDTGDHRPRDAHFEARALYGLNLAFFGLVKEERRPEIQAKLKGLERKLRMSPMSEEGTS
jgi:hypothetical protein